MDSHPKEICIKGFIKAERHASPHITKIISEILQNSLEANRIARSKGAKETEIIVTLFFNDSGIFTKITIEDYASHDSGIHNINTKQIFSLYNHVGENDGFSEFGIGGKQSCMQLGNLIEYKTKCNTSGGTLVWNISKIINGDIDNYFDSIEYNDDPLSILSPYTTGTKVSIENLESKFNSLSISNYLLYTSDSSEFKDHICKSFVKVDDREKIRFRFKKEGRLASEFYLTPSSNICETSKYYRTYKLKIYNINEKNRDCITTLVEYNNKHYRLYDDHNEFKIDKMLQSKDIFIKNNEYTISLDNQVLIGKAELKLSTCERDVDQSCKEETNRLRSEMGYDTHRRVKDGSVVRTNITPLLLQWKKFSSHRTRYNRFRGAILYDKNLDSIVQTDKCKTVSDDRHFDATFRRTILQLTDTYMKQMRDEYNLYNTEITQKITRKENNLEDITQEIIEEEMIQENSTPVPEESTLEEVITDEIIQDNSTPEENIQEENILKDNTSEEITQEDVIEEEIIQEDSTPEDTVPEEIIQEDNNINKDNTSKEITQEEVIKEETIQEDSTPKDTVEEIIQEENIAKDNTPEENIQEENTQEENIHEEITQEEVSIEEIIQDNDYTQDLPCKIIYTESHDNKYINAHEIQCETNENEEHDTFSVKLPDDKKLKEIQQISQEITNLLRIVCDNKHINSSEHLYDLLKNIKTEITRVLEI